MNSNNYNNNNTKTLLIQIGGSILGITLLVYLWKNISKQPKYIIHRNRASYGQNIGEQHTELIEQYHKLKKLCDAEPECVGFTGTGWLKSKIDTPDQWIDADYNMYLKV